jgi:uncharacterized protein with von Willebrand factor type A (vWA) domain
LRSSATRVQPADVVERVVDFGRVLRGAGLEVGPTRVGDAVSALALVGVADRERVYWTLRQTLASSVDELEAFDRAFALWFGGGRAGPDEEDVAQRPVFVAGPAGDAPGGRAAGADRGGYSADELLRQKDFATLTDDDRARLGELIRALARARPQRRSRRLRPHARGTVLDLRRLMRASLATGGDPRECTFRRRVDAPRRVVVLCDVSGSMEPYARAILLFVHALRQAGRGVEAFVFGTRLTRVTPALARRDPGRALDETAAQALDWAGGTRIGASLRAFNDRWGARGAVVVVVSDGWEIGDTAAIAQETARLHRESYALLWLNPLKGKPEYQPLAGGMRAALPHVDRFLPGHDFESLEQLADAVAGVAARHQV